jgi:glycosyltransferase involved in cell wall biosynthesis
MNGATAEFAVIVPAKNARRTLTRCLEAVSRAAALVGPVPVVLVDNGSSDGTPELASERIGPGLVVLHRPGFTVGALRNAGAAQVSARVLCFIDADCEVAPDWFLRVHEVLERTGAGAVGCYYTLPEKPALLERAWDRLHYPAADGPVGMINAGNLAVVSEPFHQAGGFDERLPTGEDAEFCQRLADRGILLWEDRSLVARHLGNPQSLGAFVAKQYWHALGALGTVRLGTLDRPFLMTLAFLATNLLALGLLLVPGTSIGEVGAALLLSVSVPLLTVGYRAQRVRRWPPIGLGTLLYWLYYAARVAALPAAWRHRPRARTTLSRV